MKIVLLGSGNVATHLGRALKASGHEIVQVWSRSLTHAQELAGSLKASATDHFSNLYPDADIYIISVNDAAITELAKKFPFKDKLVVHTSGTVGFEGIETASSKTGVFYPVQTFSKQRVLDFWTIPIAVEGKSADIERNLYALAGTISEKVVLFNSEKRKALHVAAVFACNFSNHLYGIGKKILQENDLDFDLIRPLIAETAAKVQDFFPEEVQTGPAVRNDQVVVNKHIEFLSDKPVIQELYEKLSQSIINFHQKP